MRSCSLDLREKQLGVATFLILDKQVAAWSAKLREKFVAPDGSQLVSAAPDWSYDLPGKLTFWSAGSCRKLRESSCSFCR